MVLKVQNSDDTFVQRNADKSREEQKPTTSHSQETTTTVYETPKSASQPLQSIGQSVARLPPRSKSTEIFGTKSFTEPEKQINKTLLRSQSGSASEGPYRIRSNNRIANHRQASSPLSDSDNLTASMNTSLISETLNVVSITDKDLDQDSFNETNVNSIYDSSRSIKVVQGNDEDINFKFGQLSQSDINRPKHIIDNVQYLETYVFPTLLPGIEQLLKRIKKKDGVLEEENFDQNYWLAQYLYRNNPNSKLTSRHNILEQRGKTILNTIKVELIPPSKSQCLTETGTMCMSGYNNLHIQSI